MNMQIKLLKLCLFSVLSFLQISYAYSANPNNLFSVEIKNSKTRIQYRLKAEDSSEFKSFHHLLLKAGYESDVNQDLGIATHFELSRFSLDTFLYKSKTNQDGDLVVSISISGEDESYFGNTIVSIKGNAVYPLFELVRTFGTKTDVGSGVTAYDFEKLRCLLMTSKNVTEKDVNCILIQH